MAPFAEGGADEFRWSVESIEAMATPYAVGTHRAGENRIRDLFQQLNA